MRAAKQVCLALAGIALSASCIEAASSAFQNDIAALNPLIWYKLGEPAGASLTINSGSLGSSLNGTVFNSPAFGAAGDGGDTGVAFTNGSGQQQYIQTANNVPASLQGNPTFTMEALVYLPSKGQPSTPFYAPFLWWGANGTGNSVYFSLSNQNASKVFVGFYNSGLVMTSTINLDAWNLITWVRDSNNGTNNSLTGSTLYINGVQVGTTSDTSLSGSAGIAPSIKAGPLTIERAGDFSRYFTGTVDEAVVFGTALSASVIAQHYADVIATSNGLPTINAGGVVPVNSSATTIDQGEWVSIYGTNLASTTTVWKGDFPTSLGGTSVTIDNRPAYLWFVSPTQINLQVPNDSATGSILVSVTTAAGTASSTVTLALEAPSFNLFSSKYPAAIVPTSGPGNSGAGYDYIGPSGAFSFPSRPVKAGETLLLYGVGFGLTAPPVPAGQSFSGAAPSVTPPVITIGGISADVAFAGIVEAGLFQFNVVVPDAGSGDQPLVATIGGVSTPSNIFITLQ